MDSNQCQDRTNIDGTDGSGCTCSSHSTLPPCSEHSHDIPSRHETSHPSLYSTPPQSNQEQPAARSSLPPNDRHCPGNWNDKGTGGCIDKAFHRCIEGEGSFTLSNQKDMANIFDLAANLFAKVL